MLGSKLIDHPSYSVVGLKICTLHSNVIFVLFLQQFHALPSFLVRHVHVLHLHVLHFMPCNSDGPSFSRPAFSVNRLYFGPQTRKKGPDLDSPNGRPSRWALPHILVGSELYSSRLVCVILFRCSVLITVH